MYCADIVVMQVIIEAEQYLYLYIQIKKWRQTSNRK